jgi:bifunctional DNase/RNase
MLTMRVLGLTLDDASHAPILLLQEETGRELLPIWIGAMEAMSISLALGKVPVDRPLTHDLLLLLLRSLDARLSGVELVALREGTYYADLILQLENGETRRLDCRPSDAVALALRAQAPIRVSEEILHAAAGRRVSDDGSFTEALLQTPVENDAGDARRAEEERRLAELLRALEPESRRKM